MPLNPDPHRRTYHETCIELNLSSNELMRCVAEGLIVPMVFVHAKCEAYSIEDGPDGRPLRNYLCEEYMSGCFHLVHRNQLGPTQCMWYGFSESRTADAGEMFYDFEEPYSSELLPERCCFSYDEIERFRSEYHLADMSEELKPLHSKERATAHKINIAMAKGRYGYDPQSKRGDTVNLILQEVEKLGLEVSDDTIRKWLNEAAKQIP